MREALQSAFTASDADVTVDLTEVEFVDSVILSVFVTAHKRFATGDRTLTFLVPPEGLPLFNSHAIEAWLHRIPGLAEQFVYFNDDFMLWDSVSPSTFSSR